MSKHSFGYCERTGFRYKTKDLVEEYVLGKPTGRLVGKDMEDPDHPQNWVGRLGKLTDPTPVEPARPDPSLRLSRRQFGWDPVGGATLEVSVAVGQVSVS